MDCVVNETSSIRTLCRLVQCVARIGDEITFTPGRDVLRLRALNASHSASAEFILLRPFFASFLVLNHVPTSAKNASTVSHAAAAAAVAATRSARSAPPSTPSAARVPLRALLPIFRAPATIDRLRIVLRPYELRNTTEKDRTVDRGEDAPDQNNNLDPGNVQSRSIRRRNGNNITGATDTLIISVRARSGARKTFRVPVLAGHAPHAVYAKDRAAGVIHARPRFLIDILANFHARLDEITFTPAQNALRIASFVDDTAKPQNNVLLRTEMIVDAREFDLFRVPVQKLEPSLTFYFKPFRAVLDFCEHFDSLIAMSFQDPGQPVLFTVELSNPGAAKLFEATFVFATRIVQEGDTQTPHTPSTSDATSSARRLAVPPEPAVLPQAQAHSLKSTHPIASANENEQQRTAPSQRSRRPSLQTTVHAPNNEHLQLTPSEMRLDPSHVRHQVRQSLGTFRPDSANSINGLNVFADPPVNVQRSSSIHAPSPNASRSTGVVRGSEEDSDFVEGTPPPSP